MTKIKNLKDYTNQVKKSYNPEHYKGEQENILAFLKHNNMELHDNLIYLQHYEDEEGSMVYHKPHKIFELEDKTEEPSGSKLTLVLKGKMDRQTMEKLYELMYRLRFTAWPDYEYYPLSLDGLPDDGIYYSCWHHTELAYNIAYSSLDLLYIELTYGYCYCS